MIQAEALREEGEELLARADYEAAARKLLASHEAAQRAEGALLDEAARLELLVSRVEELKARAKEEAGDHDYASALADIDTARPRIWVPARTLANPIAR